MRQFLTGLLLAFATSLPAWAQTSRFEPLVRLLDAGKEPHVQLRYRFVPDVERAQMVLRLSIGMEAGANRIPDTPLPPVRTTLELRKETAGPGEDSTLFRFSFLEAKAVQESGVDPTLIAGLNRELQILQGLSGTLEVTPSGVFRQTSFDTPRGVSSRLDQVLQSIQQQIVQLSTPFPEEPIGVGARWQLTTPVRSGDVAVSQTTAYRLVQMAGQGGQLISSVFLESDTKNEPLDTPGVSAVLESYKGNGFGQIDFNLQRLVPRTRVDVKSEAVIWAETAGATQKTTTRLGLQSTIRPVPVEPH